IICFFRLFALSPLVYFTLSLHDALPIYIQLYVFWMKLFSFYRYLLPAYWLCPAVKEDKQRNKQKTDGNNEGEKDSKSVNKARKSSLLHRQRLKGTPQPMEQVKTQYHHHKCIGTGKPRLLKCHNDQALQVVYHLAVYQCHVGMKISLPELQNMPDDKCQYNQPAVKHPSGEPIIMHIPCFRLIFLI